MKQAYLITTVGAALLAGTMFVAAQGMQKQAPGGEGGAQAQIQREPGSQPDQKGKQPGQREQGKKGTTREGAGDQQREPGSRGQQGQSKERRGNFVVGRAYNGNYWYGQNRHRWRGVWYAYGVGTCWIDVDGLWFWNAAVCPP
jgi:hypothetical protein